MVLRHAALGGMLLCALFAAGCATTPAGVNHSDPLEPVNRKVYAFNDALDKHLLKPVADAYVKVTPKPVQTSVSNFYNNLTYPDVFLNQFLQGKILLGLSDVGRFVVNTTVGIVGLFDPASDIGLVAHNEDFGQTLAVWRVPQGAYLVLPFLGPDTVRNTPDIVTSTLTNALFYVGNLYVTLPLSVLGVIDTRVQASGSITLVSQAALDPYVFVREGYLQHREFLIFDGHPPPRFYNEDEEKDPPASRGQNPIP